MEGRKPCLADLPGRSAIFGQFTDEIGEVVIAHSWVFIRRGVVGTITPTHLSQIPCTIAFYVVLPRPYGSRYRPAEISPLRPKHHCRRSLLSYCHLLRKIRCSSWQLLLLLLDLLFSHGTSHVRKSRNGLISTRSWDSLGSHPKLPCLFRKGLRLFCGKLPLASILIRTGMFDDSRVLNRSSFGEFHHSIWNAIGKLIMVDI